MLQNNLYTIEQISETEKIIQATVLLRASHPIFKGHFPEHPVLPGVCMLEMITEIAGHHLHKHIRITGAPTIKFLHMIDPNSDPLIQFEIKYEEELKNITAQGKIYSASRVFMKFQLILSVSKKN